MAATNGRGHLLRSVNVWRKQDASAMSYVGNGAWDWIAVVPADMDKPSWIPRHATLHALTHGECCWTWVE